MYFVDCHVGIYTSNNKGGDKLPWAAWVIRTFKGSLNEHDIDHRRTLRRSGEKSGEGILDISQVMKVLKNEWFILRMANSPWG